MSAQSQPPEPAGTGTGAGTSTGTAALARLRELGPQWQAAAEGAFAGAAQSPGRYVTAGRWVSGWLERLRGLPPGQVAEEAGGGTADSGAADAAAADALLEAWDTREGAVPAGAAALPLTAGERAALTACAFAIRYTEVAGWLAARERCRVMAAARAAGREGWVVLEEAGEPAGDPFITYRRLEVDPATGTGVFVTTRPDDRFVTVIHGVQPAFVDPETGTLDIENSGESFEVGSCDERETIVDSLRVRQANKEARRSD